MSMTEDKLAWLKVNDPVTQAELEEISETLETVDTDIEFIVTTDQVDLLGREEVLDYLDELREVIEADDEQ